MLLLEISKWTGDAGAGCVNTWTCCGQREDVNECTAPRNKRWTCCNEGWDSEGCIDITKVEKLYNCCKQAKGAEGCHMIYKCCKKSGKGCTYYYRCCYRGLNEEGCRRKCVNCRKDWGTGPGCVEAI